MAILTRKMIQFIKAGYTALRNEESDFACYRGILDETNRIEFLLVKKDFFYGNWALFYYGEFVMTISQELMEEWSPQPLQDEGPENDIISNF